MFSGPYLAALDGDKRKIIYQGRAASPDVIVPQRNLAIDIQEGFCCLDDAVFHGANNYFEDLSAVWISIPKEIALRGLQSQYIKLILLSDEFSRCYSLYSVDGPKRSSSQMAGDRRIVEFAGNVALETAREIAEGALGAMLDNALKRAGSSLEIYIPQNDILRLASSLEAGKFMSLSLEDAIGSVRSSWPSVEGGDEKLSTWEMLSLSQKMKSHIWIFDEEGPARQSATLILLGFGPAAKCWIEVSRFNHLAAEFVANGFEACAAGSGERPDGLFTSGFQIYWDAFIAWMLKLPSPEHEAYGSGRTLEL